MKTLLQLLLTVRNILTISLRRIPRMVFKPFRKFWERYWRVLLKTETQNLKSSVNRNRHQAQLTKSEKKALKKQNRKMLKARKKTPSKQRMRTRVYKQMTRKKRSFI